METAALTDSLKPWIESLSMTRLDPASILLAAGGILCCFFGYRTIRFLLDVSGFVATGLAAALVAGYFTEGNLAVVGIALMAGGITGGIIVHLAYRLGVVVFSGGMSALVAWYWARMAFDESNYGIALVLVAALSGAAASFLLERYAVSLITAAIGAWFAMRGILLLLEAMGITPERPDTGPALQDLSTELLAWLALTGMGVLFQLVAGRRKKGSGQ
ncbi:MAG: hypothetical protein BWY09_00543 [Candidatus Hydrogenedentes bacterium ADurb.Bin179]|nr:MAG: hypothetical protein BWY09_00543 [Candidatus Hydrogenedentes bacterium ADurb.Bin179]